MNKIVFISGASSGIGLACAHIFARHGAKLIIAARREDRLDHLSEQLTKDYGVKVYGLVLDVRERVSVKNAIVNLPNEWQSIDVLINNAGLASGISPVQDGDIDDWEKMIDTNVKGLLYLTRAILPGMLKRDAGHIINIGSIAGHEIYPNGAVYCGTKHAVRAISRGIKMDVLGSNIRVSSIDPGMVDTEFSEVRFHGDTEKAKKVYQGFTPLHAEDIADAVYYCANCPPHVNVSEILIMPTAQAAVGMTHRKE